MQHSRADSETASIITGGLSSRSFRMGNYLEKSLLGSRADVVDGGGAKRDDGETIYYCVFHYRQQMRQKDRRVLKWAEAKLSLTEQLIRMNKQHADEVELRVHRNVEDMLQGDELHDQICEQVKYLENYRRKLLKLIDFVVKYNSQKKCKKDKCKKECKKECRKRAAANQQSPRADECVESSANVDEEHDDSGSESIDDNVLEILVGRDENNELDALGIKCIERDKNIEIDYIKRIQNIDLIAE